MTLNNHNFNRVLEKSIQRDQSLKKIKFINSSDTQKDTSFVFRTQSKFTNKSIEKERKINTLAEQVNNKQAHKQDYLTPRFKHSSNQQKLENYKFGFGFNTKNKSPICNRTSNKLKEINQKQNSQIIKSVSVIKYEMGINCSKKPRMLTDIHFDNTKDRMKTQLDLKTISSQFNCKRYF